VKIVRVEGLGFLAGLHSLRIAEYGQSPLHLLTHLALLILETMFELDVSFILSF
jgi:hypothetical protein